MRIAFVAPEHGRPRTRSKRCWPDDRGFRHDARRSTVGDETPRIIIMVSKFDHCLEHLLYQIRVGWLKAEVVGIVSNHEDGRAAAEAAGIPYHSGP